MIYIKYFFLFTFCIGYTQSYSDAVTPILKIDFDDAKKSKSYNAILNIRNIEIAPNEGVSGSTGIKANYVGYEKGSQRMVRSIILPETYTEATLNYAVKFDKDFQFPLGGKLHGLGPLKPLTGGRSMRKDGWSARITFSRNGVASYAYHQNLKGKYGEGKRSPTFSFTKGVYYDMAIYVKINTPASASNGEVLIYANGKEIVSNKGLQFRGIEGKNTEINSFLFSTFHGGSSPEFAPKDSHGNYKTVVAWFDNFEVYKGFFVRKQKK